MKPIPAAPGVTNTSNALGVGRDLGGPEGVAVVETVTRGSLFFGFTIHLRPTYWVPGVSLVNDETADRIQ